MNWNLFLIVRIIKTKPTYYDDEFEPVSIQMLTD